MHNINEHIKEYSMVYLFLALIGASSGLATITDNLPVTQAEFKRHLAENAKQVYEIENIKENVDALLLNQLRTSLRQAYKDHCNATDKQAIRYINTEISSLQDQYIQITGRRFDAPPC